MARLVWLVLAVQAVCGVERREGLIDRLSSGMKLATDLLGKHLLLIFYSYSNPLAHIDFNLMGQLLIK